MEMVLIMLIIETMIIKEDSYNMMVIFVVMVMGNDHSNSDKKGATHTIPN